MQRTLQAFGATSFGNMENFDKGEVIVQFEWHGAQSVSVQASGRRAMRAIWLRRHPYTYRMENREDRL